MSAIHQALLALHNPVGVGGACGDPLGGVAGLDIWFDAMALGLSNGDEIDTWQDCSGNDRHATGVVGGTLKPTYRATDGPDGNPCVRLVTLANVGGYFTLPNFLSGPEKHGFAVVKMDSGNAGDAPPIADFGTAGDSYFAFTDSRIFDDFCSTVRKEIPAGNYTGDHNITNWFLWELRSAAGLWSAWMDGDQIFTTASNTVAYSSAPFIGHTVVNNKNCRGMVAEILLYDHILNGTEYANFKADMTTKHGLILA